MAHLPPNTMFVVRDQRQLRAALSAPVGAIAVGSGILGDGSAGDPLRLDPASVAGFVVPTGTVTQYAGIGAPSGWLPCNATPVGRAEYADLFAVIGTTYGDGNGTTTFNVPNFIDRGPIGAGSTASRGEAVGSATHTHFTPSHTHSLPSHTHSVPQHEHPLDSTGHARITVANDDIFLQRHTALSNWDANRRTNLTINDGPSIVTQTTSVPLYGTTGFAGPWTSGAGGAGNTGAGGVGSTGATSSYGPSLGINFIIKT